MKRIAVLMIFLLALITGCDLFEDNLVAPDIGPAKQISKVTLYVPAHGLAKTNAVDYKFFTNAVLNSDSSGTHAEVFTFAAGQEISFYTIVTDLTEGMKYKGRLMNGPDMVFSNFTLGGALPSNYVIGVDNGIDFQFGVRLDGSIYQRDNNLADTAYFNVRVYSLSNNGHFEVNGTATDFKNKPLVWNSNGYYETLIYTIEGSQRYDVWGYGANVDSAMFGNTSFYDISGSYIMTDVFGNNDIEILDSVATYNKTRISVEENEQGWSTVKGYLMKDNTLLDSFVFARSGTKWIINYTLPTSSNLKLRVLADSVAQFQKVEVAGEELHHLIKLQENSNEYWFEFSLTDDYKLQQGVENRYPLIGSGD